MGDGACGREGVEGVVGEFKVAGTEPGEEFVRLLASNQGVNTF